MDQFISFILLGILNGVIYAVIALGFNLIYRASGVLNFAHGYFAMIGAIIVWVFAEQFSLPIWFVPFAALGCMVLLGFLVERLTVRPLLGQPILATIVMTLGLAILIEAGASLVWGNQPKAYSHALLPAGTFYIGNVALPQTHIYGIAIAVLMFSILLPFLQRSKMGLAMQAIADDTKCALTLGISVTRILSSTWIIAAISALFGGYLIANIVGIEIPSLPLYGLKALAVIIFAGLESVGGLLIAGPIVGIIESLAAGYLDPLVGGGLREIVPYVVILIILIVRPYGLFGWKRIERV